MTSSGSLANSASTRSSQPGGTSVSASMLATSVPHEASNPALRAWTNPLRGSRTSLMPGTASATSAVRSVLALSTTTTSAATPVRSISARIALRQRGSNASSL